MNPATGMAIAQGANALIGTLGSLGAADAQRDAARRQQQTATRNMLAQLGLAEPARGVGYQALSDMAGLYGYSVPDYPTMDSIQARLTPLGVKGVKRGLKDGMSVDQLAQMGTLGQLDRKALRRLTKMGLTPDDIAKLQGRGQSFTPPKSEVGSTGNTTQQSLLDRITTMPGYQFGLQEGTNALTQSAANRGGLFSGDTGKSLFQWGRDYSASKFGEDWNRLAQLAGHGAQGTAQASGAMNAGTNATMGAQQQMGDARASGILGVTNSIGNGINDGVNNWLMWDYMNGGGSGPQTYWRPGAATLPGGGSINPTLPWIGG